MRPKPVLLLILFVATLASYAQKNTPEPVYDHTGYIKYLDDNRKEVSETTIGDKTVRCLDSGDQVQCSDRAGFGLGMLMAYMDKKDAAVIPLHLPLPIFSDSKGGDPLVDLATPLRKNPNADAHFQYRVIDDWKNPLTKKKEGAFCVPYPKSKKSQKEVCYSVLLLSTPK